MSDQSRYVAGRASGSKATRRIASASRPSRGSSLSSGLTACRTAMRAEDRGEQHEGRNGSKTSACAGCFGAVVHGAHADDAGRAVCRARGVAQSLPSAAILHDVSAKRSFTLILSPQTVASGERDSDRVGALRVVAEKDGSNRNVRRALMVLASSGLFAKATASGRRRTCASCRAAPRSRRDRCPRLSPSLRARLARPALSSSTSSRTRCRPAPCRNRDCP